MEDQSVRPRFVNAMGDVKQRISNKFDENDDEFSAKLGKNYPIYHKLGYKHWIFFFLYAAGIYFAVVLLDKRLPAPLGAEQFEIFSEARARADLVKLCSYGPRVSGSYANEVMAYKLITDSVQTIKSDMRAVHRIDTKVQRPSGCFDLDFLAGFTLCYQNVTNIIVRFGPSTVQQSDHSVLVSCHFDSVPDSPGATDDGVSCMIMLEMLRVLSQSENPLPNDIIFLFNGAEENFLQAAHGFITTDPWRHTIRAFINLEGAGGGGRELLFQAGPGNAWLMQAYLESAPYPHCSVVGMEVFQSGIIPSDTDFRIYRDYGRVPGLDIAYIRNGYVYHTENDKPEFIEPGSIQRAGENVLATVRNLAHSKYLGHPADYQEGRWVFFDFIGLGSIYYHYDTGVLVNWITFVLVLIKVAFNFYCKQNDMKQMKTVLRDCGYSMSDFVWATLTVILAAGFTIVTIMTLTLLVTYSGVSMVWYASPWLISLIYVLPGIAAGLVVHNISAERYWKKSHPSAVERCHMDSVMFLLSILMVFVTFKGYASAFVILFHVFPPLFRDAIVAALRKVFGKTATTTHPSFTFSVHVTIMLPTVALGCYSILLFMEIFIPIMGRSGMGVNPEMFIAGVAALASVGFVLLSASFTYASRRIGYIIKCIFAGFLYLCLILFCTRLGEPYSASETAPRLRRVHLQHISRTLYNIDGSLGLKENGIWVASMDYRGVEDLPGQSFIEGTRPPICLPKSNDEFCNMPYYVPIHEILPPQGTRWISVPNPPELTIPLDVQMKSKAMINENTVNITFTITGPDHITGYLSPVDDWKLQKWSFDNGQNIQPMHQTYFLYLATAYNDLPKWEFWATFKKPEGTISEKVMQLGVASHILHGPKKLSKTLEQTFELIRGRRKATGFALGWWKWAMTPNGWGSEYIGKYY